MLTDAVNQEFGQGTVGIAYLCLATSVPAAGDNSNGFGSLQRIELYQLRLQIHCQGGFFANLAGTSVGWLEGWA